ncbi:PTS sugar transporter subunit IIA [Pseudodesulfovibrio tunisiensis]|uniref:PTS sugar transporter subunit IIA n=1 Tax=Pseudodesulfovibrio tunisiensis TaxID=463192 RepID=UPI001FB324E5|nr:PTS sugar transporter subunit IIA [Pseudodesulfovibrio tunisiensis]
MILGDYLDKKLIFPNLVSSTKSEVLKELVAPLGEAYSELDANEAVRVLLEREGLGSTGIGDGIAIPHGKLDDLDRILVLVGRSSEGVEFDALDHKPCHIFFLVLAPAQVAGMHLRILAHISRLLRDSSFRQEFMDAVDADTLWNLLKNA